MAPSRARDARVAFAQLVGLDPSLSLFALRESLDASLAVGTTIERYGRIWRMGQFRRGGRTVTGRIGYEKPGSLSELWDHQINDFREQRLVEGQTSPFALNVENLAVVFQLRSGQIKHTSFTGAFQALLNDALGDDVWRVRPIVLGVPWDRWRDSVVRVRHLELKMERPNPNYHGRAQVERIVEGTNARLAKLVLDADPNDPQGLDVNDTLVREAIEHALQEYGDVKAVGDVRSRAGRQESTWRSDVEGAPVETRAPIDPETREVPEDELRKELPDSAPDQIDADLRNQYVAPPPEEA